MRNPSEGLALALLICAACTALSCGCSREPAEADLSGLEVSRYRLNVDDAHRVARVMGEVYNGGKATVDEAVVIGALRGPAEEPYDSGLATIKKIAPGEARLFSLRIPARGDERDVEFSILTPEQARSKAPAGPVAD